MPDTAAYYADKLVTFSGFERETVLLLAKVWKPNGAEKNMSEQLKPTKNNMRNEKIRLAFGADTKKSG